MSDDRRAALCDWLSANGVDPNRVPRDSEMWTEPAENTDAVLHFEQYDVDENGRPVLNERGDRAAIRYASVLLTVQPPDWWQPHRKPTRDQLADHVRDAYRERAHLLGLLATLYPSHIQDDPADPDWPVLYVHLPTGQATWHIAKDDLDLFAHVRTDLVETWDGHTTQEKYQRLREHTAERERAAR